MLKTLRPSAASAAKQDKGSKSRIVDDSEEEDEEEEYDNVDDPDDESVEDADGEGGSSEDEEADDAMEADESARVVNTMLQLAEEGNAVEAEVKSGWADAMAKVLKTGSGTTSTSSATLLAKAKKDWEKSGVKPVEGQEAAVEKKPPSFAVKRARKKEKDSVGRIKPDVAKDRTREKQLAKLATKGVVQLFNAVREQQKSLRGQLDVAGRSARKRDKVFKNIDKEGFLEVLTGGKKRSSTTTTMGTVRGAKKTEPEVKDEEDESTWKILRDDFMMGAKMKDWDKNSESDE